MFSYQIYTADGDEIGEASYIDGRRFRVLDVAPFAEEDESVFVAMLKVEAL